MINRIIISSTISLMFIIIFSITIMQLIMTIILITINSLSNDSNAKKKIYSNKKTKTMIMKRVPENVEKSKIVKSVCLDMILYIHSLVRAFFRTYQWQP